MKLQSIVELDEITSKISSNFDYVFDGTTSFEIPLAWFPNEYQIGLIVGPSGSGKSTMLERLKDDETLYLWNERKAIVSHFKSAEEAQEKLAAVGFNSIPSWMRPYHVLSTGEKFRADIARRLKDNACIDEFTSVVDRNVAKSCSFAIQRYIRKNNLQKVVFASCHYDIIEWLQPDWVFDTITKIMTPRRLLRQPTIEIQIKPCSTKEWSLFSDHHYLTNEINKSSRCWIALWNGIPVGFNSSLAFPNGNFNNGWRESRTVVLPDFQGLGIGMLISEAIGEIMLYNKCRYFSKTAHPRVGEYRNSSVKWKGTSKNGKARLDYNTTKTITKEDTHKLFHAHRICFSHEYVGNKV